MEYVLECIYKDPRNLLVFETVIAGVSIPTVNSDDVDGREIDKNPFWLERRILLHRGDDNREQLYHQHRCWGPQWFTVVKTAGMYGEADHIANVFTNDSRGAAQKVLPQCYDRTGAWIAPYDYYCLEGLWSRILDTKWI